MCNAQLRQMASDISYLTTNGFLEAFKHMVNRPGAILHVYSNNRANNINIKSRIQWHFPRLALLTLVDCGNPL